MHIPNQFLVDAAMRLDVSLDLGNREISITGLPCPHFLSFCDAEEVTLGDLTFSQVMIIIRSGSPVGDLVVGISLSLQCFKSDVPWHYHPGCSEEVFILHLKGDAELLPAGARKSEGESQLIRQGDRHGWWVNDGSELLILSVKRGSDFSAVLV